MCPRDRSAFHAAAPGYRSSAPVDRCVAPTSFSVALQGDRLRQTEGRFAAVALEIGDVLRLIEIINRGQVDIHRAPAEVGDAGLIDGAGIHLTLIHDLAALDQAFLDHCFGAHHSRS